MKRLGFCSLLTAAKKERKKISEFKNGHISRFCCVFQVIQVILSAKFSLRKKLTSASTQKRRNTDFEPFFLEKRPWKRFSTNVLILAEMKPLHKQKLLSVGYQVKQTWNLVLELTFRNVTPSTHQIYSRNWYVCFLYVKTHKVSTSIRGGFHILLHKTFLEQVHSARLSCTADTRPLNEFEKGPNLAENRVEYFLLTTWDGNSIFFSSNRARPGSQKLPLNGFTEWNSDKNKEKAYQNRE